MFASISFRIANWKLALLTLLIFALLMSLGFWQIARAREKRDLIASFTERTLSPPLRTLHAAQDLRYYRAELTGYFDNAHSLLLDNKIHEGIVGYEVYTPFIAQHLPVPILIDRGFIPLGSSRNTLPVLKNIEGNVRLLGMLNLPPTYVSLGDMLSDREIKWPKRVEYIDLEKLFGKNKIYPYIFIIDPHDPAAYEVTWQAIVTMPPERHVGYAVQWFALAVTLLILFFVLNRKEVQT